MIYSSTIAIALACAAALAYAAAALPIISARSGTLANRAPLFIGGIAVALHAAVVVQGWMGNGGLSSSFYDALSLAALIVVLVTLAYRYSRQLSALLLPVYLTAAVSVTLAAGFGHYSPIETDSPGMLLHIISAVCGYALLCLAALYALVLSAAERGLRKGRSGPWLNALPALDAMEKHLFSLLLATWLVITLSIGSGAVYVDDMLAQHIVHKTAFTVGSWLVLAVLLLGRHFYGWRGRTAVRWTLVAFVALALGYLGSKFVLDVLLHRV